MAFCYERSNRTPKLSTFVSSNDGLDGIMGRSAGSRLFGQPPLRIADDPPGIPIETPYPVLPQDCRTFQRIRRARDSILRARCRVNHSNPHRRLNQLKPTHPFFQRLPTRWRDARTSSRLLDAIRLEETPGYERRKDQRCHLLSIAVANRAAAR